MNRFYRIFPLVMLAILFSVTVAHAQTGSAANRYKPKASLKKERGVKVKETKVQEPKSVVKAKKEQEKKEQQRQRENEKAVAEGKKRHFEIQSESVKERMKQNEKEALLREKERKKSIRKASKPASRKYKK